MEIVDGSGYIKEIKELIIEYIESLDRDLTFQGVEEELADLGKKYGGTNGQMLAALSEDNQVVGCVAYYQHSDVRCEMKRLYVKPAYRKLKLGEQLVKKLMEEAKRSGYTEMVLDTAKPLKGAIALYHKCGFQETEPYYYNPMEDVVYMIKKL